ncbi:MAG: alanyl-tRNA editing protein [Burkholderiaceae bacterium]
MPTRALYREDASLRVCESRITHVFDDGFELEATVFYPHGGGQAGDTGRIRLADGRVIDISDTVKSRREGATPDDACHKPVDPSVLTGLVPGQPVQAEIDWPRRHRMMRFHTSTHLLCALIAHPVNGCSIQPDYARIDFDMTEALDKSAIQRGLDALIAAGHPCTSEWIDDDALRAQPELVRTMSVAPPLGFGRVRLLRIAGVDLQPCGGTHVSNTAEIGDVRIAKIEKKSARTRRLTLRFGES